MTRYLYGLLTAVAVAAAVLSFDALRGLALLCGFSRSLAWLLPVVVDAGAAAGSLVWLGGRAPARAGRFARALALVLLGSSVAANALSHGLAAYARQPPWWVVVLVSGVAPAVLGATVHLAVLASRGVECKEPGLSLSPDVDDSTLVGSPTEPPADIPADIPAQPPAVALHSVPSPPGDAGDRVAELVAAGAGWRKVQKETGLSEHHAKKAIREHRNGTSG